MPAVWWCASSSAARDKCHGYRHALHQPGAANMPVGRVACLQRMWLMQGVAELAYGLRCSGSAVLEILFELRHGFNLTYI